MAYQTEFPKHRIGEVVRLKQGTATRLAGKDCSNFRPHNCAKQICRIFALRGLKRAEFGRPVLAKTTQKNLFQSVELVPPHSSSQ